MHVLVLVLVLVHLHVQVHVQVDEHEDEALVRSAGDSETVSVARGPYGPLRQPAGWRAAMMDGLGVNADPMLGADHALPTGSPYRGAYGWEW